LPRMPQTSWRPAWRFCARSRPTWRNSWSAGGLSQTLFARGSSRWSAPPRPDDGRANVDQVGAAAEGTCINGPRRSAERIEPSLRPGRQNAAASEFQLGNGIGARKQTGRVLKTKAAWHEATPLRIQVVALNR